ncbi:RluA family pseudouridine synthase [Leptolyngbya sp. FACHB-16]|uniref:RluA family pseudouridine synthase n=1 Tax=unclassified Leptolyngbya TaxID=2650499 RepID=UPI00168409A7|nr:RluA family pseudouridine synthase [Leptolyngbya sp. FACHB-16]MBD2154645.1 RluA family pseudouridine synthase [Leptolyngbya sp. FACHB-16]
MAVDVTLQAAFAGDRLDRWLSEHLPDLSRARIQKLIDQGQVQVNGQICTSKKMAIQAGDRIDITIPDATPLELEAQSIPLDILYEDDSLLILNKPTGLVVHPAPGHEDGTLVNALLAHCPNLTGIGGVQRPGIVHRLDKDTSGAIAIAKTDQAHQHLQAQFKAKTARRTYLAVVYGAPKESSGTVDAPIGRHLGDRKKMAVVPLEKGGRPAITHWQVQERLGNYSLMQYDLETGRTHQIRVHSAHIGHPVVGDPVYSSGRPIGINLPGQALHAWRLRLQHPLTEEWIEAIAPLPDYLTKLVQVLRQRMGHHQCHKDDYLRVHPDENG